MPRNLDLTALRSFVTAAEMGGVTRAAARLNLTQSAVSMQLKRLEEALGQPLIDRTARTIRLTPQGEQLLGYGKRLMALNDEAWGRLTHSAYEGAISFGVPHDIIYPHVPRVLQAFASAYPRVQVQLQSLYTSGLKAQFAAGEIDLILTTEAGVDPSGETLICEPLVWAGAQGGQAWRNRPLRFASCGHCVFKRSALATLDREGIPWEFAVESISGAAVEASVAADLAVSVHMQGAVPHSCEWVRSGLPILPEYCINMYLGTGPKQALASHLAAVIRTTFAIPRLAAAE